MELEDNSTNTPGILIQIKLHFFKHSQLLIRFYLKYRNLSKSINSNLLVGFGSKIAKK